VGVCAATSDEASAIRSAELSAELNLPVVAADDRACDLLLVVTHTGLELREVGCAGGVKADLGASGENAGRLAGASRRQPIARAVGMKKRTPTVVDATAGLGRDAMLLARLGCSVTAVERSPIAAALLRDALVRASAESAVGKLMPHELTLVVGDAAALLAAMSEQEAPDVVYLDPMYPPSGKSALPKKAMRILRRLVGDDPDADALLAAARRIARERVVVKRTPRATALASSSPTMSYRGKLVRYDVYVTRKE